MRIAGFAAICVVVATMAGAAEPVRVEPDCSFGDPTFKGGLNGYCSEIGPQRFRVRYTTFAGADVLVLEWPGELRSPAVTDCEELCRAGALGLALTTATERAAGMTSSGGGCELSANAAESYDTGDLCGSGEEFRCHGACGLGCIGCEVEFGLGACPPLCETVSLSCYTRPCCQTHDDCLSAATTPDEELACHLQAAQDGCGPADAEGTTNNYPDAECLDFQICRDGVVLEEPPQVRPIQH